MTILTTGILVVILMVIAVGVAITGVHLERTELQSMADGSALAGSQAFEESSFYGPDATRGGAPTIGHATARRAVEDYLASYPESSDRTHGVSVTDVTVDGDGTVHVTLAARTDPPLVGWFTRGTNTSVTITARGDARSR